MNAERRAKVDAALYWLCVACTVVLALAWWLKGLIRVATPYVEVTPTTLRFGTLGSMTLLVSTVACWFASRRSAEPRETALRSISRRHAAAGTWCVFGTVLTWGHLNGITLLTYGEAHQRRETIALYFVATYLLATVMPGPLRTLIRGSHEPLFTGIRALMAPLRCPVSSPEENRYHALACELLRRVPTHKKLDALLRYMDVAADEVLHGSAPETRDAVTATIIKGLEELPPERQVDAFLRVMQVVLRKGSPEQVLAMRRSIASNTERCPKEFVEAVLNMIDGHLALHQIITTDVDEERKPDTR